MPAILDREVRSEGDDAFGHRHFALALEHLIESPENVPPYSIGLLGSWGMGKSSIKELYLSGLRESERRDNSGAKRRERVFTVTFNAWRYGGENIKRALLRHVFRELGGNEGDLFDALFNQSSRTKLEMRPVRELTNDIVAGYRNLLIAAGIFVVSLSFLVGILCWLFGMHTYAIIVAIVSALVSSSVLATKLLDSKWIIPTMHTPHTRIEMPNIAVEQFESHLMRQILVWKDSSGKKVERLVVFVDDLDRLSSEEMVSGLDAIRMFMDIASDSLPKSFGIVFVVSCDEDRVASALSAKGRSGAELPGAVLSRNDARRYLDRIFQFRLEIPPLPKQDMRGFAKDRLRQHAPYIWDALGGEQGNSAVDDVIDRLIHIDVNSPRSAIQLLNAFIESWWIAERREWEGAGTSRPGGLRERAVTDYPEALAAVCVLRVDFPDFYGELEREPRLLTWFRDVFVRGSKLSEQPAAVREALTTYHDSESDTVNRKSRRLLRFLSSIDGVRLPVSSLQPLLLLSQDRITRQVGDVGRPVFEALISGDRQGVLQALGREADGGTLSPEQVRLLREIDDGLRAETPSRRNNADAVLVELAPRLSHELAPQILAPVSRRLAESADLRWRVGIEGISEVARRVEGLDRRGVAEVLVDDLLLLEGEVTWRLRSGGEPSLQECVGIVTSAAELILEVYSEMGLPSVPEARLRDWLVLRRVAVGQREQKLTISQLEDWMSQFENKLTALLGDRYVELLTRELEAGGSDGLDEDGLIRRVQTILQRLYESGEEDRAKLWDYLTRWSIVRWEAAVMLSLRLIQEHSPPADAFTQFAGAFAKRLTRAANSPADWDLVNGSSAAAVLLQLLRQRAADVQETAYSALQSLAITWGTDQERGQLACSLAQVLGLISPDTQANLLTDWATNFSGGLSEPVRDWLADSFMSTLSPSQRTAIVGVLAQIAEDRGVSSSQAEVFRRFLDRLSDDSLRSDEVVGATQRIFEAVRQSPATPPDHLRAIFPAVPRLLPFGDQAAAGAMLREVFTRTLQTDPSLYGRLHQIMTGSWPHRSGELTPYDPDEFFDTAIRVLSQHPSDSLVMEVCTSLRDLVKRGVVGEERAQELLSAACDAWAYFPVTASELLQAEAVLLPPPDKLAVLMERIDVSDPPSVQRLSATWNSVASRASAAYQAEVLQMILGKPPRGPEGEPDLGLRLWVDAIGSLAAGQLAALAPDPTVPDEQRKRIWLQMLNRRNKLGLRYFLAQLPEILKVPDSPSTLATVLAAEADILSLASSTDEKFDLGNALLSSLPELPTVESKNRIAGWIARLGNPSIMRNLDRVDGLTSDDVDILDMAMPNNDSIRRWKDRHRSSD